MTPAIVSPAPGEWKTCPEKLLMDLVGRPAAHGWGWRGVGVGWDGGGWGWAGEGGGSGADATISDKSCVRDRPVFGEERLARCRRFLDLGLRIARELRGGLVDPEG